MYLLPFIPMCQNVFGGPIIWFSTEYQMMIFGYKRIFNYSLATLVVTYFIYQLTGNYATQLLILWDTDSSLHGNIS